MYTGSSHSKACAHAFTTEDIKHIYKKVTREKKAKPLVSNLKYSLNTKATAPPSEDHADHKSGPESRDAASVRSAPKSDTFSRGRLRPERLEKPLVDTMSIKFSKLSLGGTPSTASPKNTNPWRKADGTDSNIIQGEWSKEDDAKLVQLRNARSLSWSEIGTHFPSKPLYRLQQHYVSLIMSSASGALIDADPKSKVETSAVPASLQLKYPALEPKRIGATTSNGSDDSDWDVVEDSTSDFELDWEYVSD